jgi:ABC-2 type transport system ATP-binding protein
MKTSEEHDSMIHAPVLRLENVTKIILNRTVVDKLCLDIYPGEILGVLGPNGAGKTTAIRMAVGLMGPTTGSISISGYSLRDNYSNAIKQVGVPAYHADDEMKSNMM